MAKKYDLNIIFRVTDKMTASLAKMSGTVGGFSKKLDFAGKKMSQFGRKMTMGVTLPLVGLGTVAIKSANDFNKGMANVATMLTGLENPSKRLGELKDATQDLAISLGKSTGDMAGGLFQVVSAFGDSAESMDRLRIAGKAAVAGQATTIDSIRLLSAVTKGYGDTSAAALQKAADLAFKTNELGQTTFPELANSMGRVVPFAAALKVSQEELFGSFATLTGVTGNANEVATQMRGVLSGLVKPTDKLQEVVKSLGFESGIAMVKEKGLQESLTLLTGAVGGSEEVMAEMFGNVRALNAIFALTGAQADTFREKTDKMRMAAGAAGKAFDAQTKGINKAGFSWDKFKVKMQVVAQQFGQVILPAFQSGIEILGKYAEKLNMMDDETKKNIVKFAAMAAAIGPVIFVVGKLITTAGLLAKAFSFLAANPFVLAIAGATALAAAIVILSKKLWGTKSNIEDLRDVSKELRQTQDDYIATVDKLTDSTNKLTESEKLNLQIRKDQLKLDIINQTEKAISKIQKLTKVSRFSGKSRIQILREDLAKNKQAIQDYRSALDRAGGASEVQIGGFGPKIKTSTARKLLSGMIKKQLGIKGELGEFELSQQKVIDLFQRSKSLDLFKDLKTIFPEDIVGKIQTDEIKKNTEQLKELKNLMRDKKEEKTEVEIIVKKEEGTNAKISNVITTERVIIRDDGSFGSNNPVLDIAKAFL
jgi:TP901 family phage tail tape measure protein